MDADNAALSVCMPEDILKERKADPQNLPS